MENKRRAAGWPPPHGWSELDLEGAAPPLSFSLSTSFPLSLSWKGRGLQLGLGIQVGLPYGAPPPEPPASSSLLYIRGQGHPKDTQVSLNRVRAPSTVTHLGHIVVVLRRSPAPVTSSSPSPRRCADGTLPRPQLDQQFEGRHRAKRVLIAEVPYIRYLDRLDREDV